MGPFHERRGPAEEIKRQMEDDPRIESAAVSLEPYNGWVVRVVPKRMELPDLVGLVEISGGPSDNRRAIAKTRKMPTRLPETEAGKPLGEKMTPNLRAAMKHPSGTFLAVGETRRKEGTEGRAAFDWLKANPGATANEIAEAGSFMHHIDWDLKKTATIKKEE